ncbi:MAG: hypothetical protein WBZ27_16770, partial [Pseudolabrys sp.]
HAVRSAQICRRCCKLSAGGWINACASYFIAGDDSRRLAFILYQAITRQISRDAFWTAIAIACGFSLNLIYLWFAKPGEPPVAIEYKPPVAVEEKAPVVDKANDAGPQPDEVSGKRGLTPNCEKELRRTADLLRFFANRIQTGEETQSVVADVNEQEKRIASVCPD